MKEIISVIVPCYNQANYLSSTLKSIFNQTYKNWECIIIDDGSLDNTGEIAKGWCQKDSRFKYYYKENGGLSSARNLGLEKAAGDYFQFLDADDLIDINKFQSSIVAGEGEKIVISNFRDFKDDPDLSTEPFRPLQAEFFTFENLLFNWDYTFNIPIHCGLFPANLLISFKFPETLKAKEDWIMWLYLFYNYKADVIFIDKPFALYRDNQNGMTKNAEFMRVNKLKALKYFPQILPFDTYVNFYSNKILQQEKEIQELQKKIINYRRTKTYTYYQKVINSKIYKFFKKKFN